MKLSKSECTGMTKKLCNFYQLNRLSETETDNSDSVSLFFCIFCHAVYTSSLAALSSAEMQEVAVLSGHQPGPKGSRTCHKRGTVVFAASLCCCLAAILHMALPSLNPSTTLVVLSALISPKHETQNYIFPWDFPLLFLFSERSPTEISLPSLLTSWHFIGIRLLVFSSRGGRSLHLSFCFLHSGEQDIQQWTKQSFTSKPFSQVHIKDWTKKKINFASITKVYTETKWTRVDRSGFQAGLVKTGNLTDVMMAKEKELGPERPLTILVKGKEVTKSHRTPSWFYPVLTPHRFMLKPAQQAVGSGGNNICHCNKTDRTFIVCMKNAMIHGRP